MNDKETPKETDEDAAPNKTPDELSPEELKAFTEDVIRSQMFTPDRLYVDLAVLKDLEIGAIMALAFEEGEAAARKAYQVIQKELPEYRKRYFADAAHYFFAAGYDNDRVKKTLYDLDWSDRIFCYAPNSEVTSVLFAHFLINANHSEVSGKTNPVKMDVNIWPLKLNKTHTASLGLYLAETLRADVRIIRKDLKELSLKEALEYDEFYLHYINEFSHNLEINKGFTDMAFAETRIFASPICGYAFDASRSAEELRQELVQREASFEIFTNMYKHIPIVHLSPPLPKKEKEDDSGTDTNSPQE